MEPVCSLYRLFLVPERPQSPASSPVVSLLSVSPLCLVLSWSGPCYDGGSAVLGYVVEVRRKGPAESGGWSELTAHCKSTSYKVRSGLEPQGEYCFRVRAYNVVGVSEPSEESPLIKMEQRGEPCRCLVDWFQQESYTLNFIMCGCILCGSVGRAWCL